jgi:hypothetical protein
MEKKEIAHVHVFEMNLGEGLDAHWDPEYKYSETLLLF